MAKLGRTILVLMNGPKDSGKDSIADEYRKDLGHYVDTFHPMTPGRKYTELLLGYELSDRGYEEMKDIPNPRLAQLSIRQAMIDFSENIVKPRLGEDAFTQIMLRKMLQCYEAGPSQQVFIVTSLGFEEEVRAIERSDYFLPQNILLVKVSRRGCTFEGDSRSYVDRHKFPGISHLSLQNNGIVEEAAHMLAARIDQMQAVNF